MTAIFSSKSQ